MSPRRVTSTSVDPSGPELRGPVSEVSLRALAEAAGDAIVSIDENGVIQWANGATTNLFGFSAEELIGRNVSVLMPSPYCDEHDGYIARYLRTGEARIIGIGREVNGRRKDGQVFPIYLSVTEVIIDGRRVFTAIIHDITTRKQAEDALRRERDFAERLVDTMQAIVLVLDRRGRILRINRFLERVSGYTDEEVRGRDWFALFIREGERAQARSLFEDALRGEPVRSIAGGLVTKEGREREVEWSATGLHDEHGQVIGLLCTGQDITERRRTEAELRELQKSAQQRERLADIGAITAKIAHDLGNPLAAVSMQAQLIVRRARRDPEKPISAVLGPAEQIVNEARRLDAMIKDFMSFSREQRLEVHPIQLRGFLQGLVDLWNPVAHKREAHMRLYVPDDLPELVADEEKLRRVLDNLVVNAVDAVGEGPGEIVVRASLLGGEKIRISVEDSGSGVPESVQLFRLFETTKPHGTGLGLAIAKQIVLAHGGDIQHVAREPKGAIFRIELPLHRASV